MSTLSQVLPANEARSNFYQILEEAGQNLRLFTITHRGKPPVVIMAAEELESWRETLEIMTNKKLMAGIAKALSSSKVYTQKEANKLIGW
ncbi:MAG: type II toxin-antitoxin system Phd/YefM family antitoxin [Candidatus Woesebacteria bacterium]|nr:type II toxin-antitoxin system Phd/YefM family antitoxin [Candidatus Woesebacteria bacterium]